MPSRREQLYRELRILQMIQLNSCLSAKDLARELEVSTRTIFRDIQNLQDCRFPVTYENGGYRLPRDYYFPQVNLDGDEILSLFLASRFLLSQKRLPFERPLQSLLKKVEGHLKPEYKKLLEGFDSQFAVGIPEGVYEEKKEIMELINRGILQHRSIEILYHTLYRNETGERLIDPYGLIFMQGNWYIVAYCHIRHSIREFHIRRIREAVLTDRTFTLPKGFNVSSHVSHNWDYGEGDPQEVRTHHSVMDACRIREVPCHPTQSIEECDDGSLFMTVNVREPENMIPWLLSRMSDVEILSPAGLRAHFQEEVRKILSKYDRP